MRGQSQTGTRTIGSNSDDGSLDSEIDSDICLIGAVERNAQPSGEMGMEGRD